MPPPNNRLALGSRNAMLDPNALGQTVPTPYIPGTTPTPIPRFVPGRELENLSIGMGRGIVGQMEGAKQMLTSPVQTAKAILETARQIGADPMVVLQMLQSARQQAMSGSLGAGEFAGGMLPMPSVRRPPVMRELDVYHGTPHRFPATEANPLGEFDASKIGTGEGAQVYGHGIYYAESPEVASSYATMNQTSAPSRASFIRLRDQAPQGSAEWNHYDNLAKEGVGSLYKADLPDEMIDRMLDWDKPLSQQPEIYKKVLSDKNWRKRLEFRTDKQVGDLTGADLYRMGHDQTARLGIPGIKYLDAGSRGGSGTGTRNFVVFPGEEKKVRILERK
jgi:hypothetical protein